MAEARVVKNLERWQTLIGSVFALLAALLSVFFLRRQIRQAEDHENKRVERRDIAARALLPIFLEQISEFCVELAARLKKLYQPTHGAVPEHLLVSFEPHKVSPEALSALQSTMENITEKSAVDQLRQIIQLYQILLSRTKSLANRSKSEAHIKIVTSSNIDAYIIDCAKLYYCVSALYPYARNEIEVVCGCFTDARRYAALNLLGFNDASYSRLYPRRKENADG